MVKTRQNKNKKHRHTRKIKEGSHVHDHSGKLWIAEKRDGKKIRWYPKKVQKGGNILADIGKRMAAAVGLKGSDPVVEKLENAKKELDRLNGKNIHTGHITQLKEKVNEVEQKYISNKKHMETEMNNLETEIKELGEKIETHDHSASPQEKDTSSKSPETNQMPSHQKLKDQQKPLEQMHSNNETSSLESRSNEPPLETNTTPQIDMRSESTNMSQQNGGTRYKYGKHKKSKKTKRVRFSKNTK
jgi:hypothetical protein